ncbi:MAG: heavy-metal-associated domain-containing protein [Candidatus Micrarchaeota archaeon]
MRQTFYTTGMECEACSKLIAKVVERIPGASLVETDLKTGKITVECAESDEMEIVKAVGERGYALSKNPLQQEPKRGLWKSLEWFANGVMEGKAGFALERKLAENAALSFIAIAILGIGVSAVFNAWNYFWLFILLAFSISTNALALWHSAAYRSEFTCMSGMMIGMTVGMMSGFTIGALLAATNGMFVGSVVGMVVGMAIGAYCGYCCGVMGLLEGLMAGLMAGIMGAMTTIMLLNDRPLEFLFVLFAACGMILAALSYMMYKEAGGFGRERALASRAKMIGATVGVAAVLIAIMVFGPKGPLVWVGA